MLLAARGTAGQLLPCSVLVWRAALRTVTMLYTHTRIHTHTQKPANELTYTVAYTYADIMLHTYDQITHILSYFTVQIESKDLGGFNRKKYRRN